MLEIKTEKSNDKFIVILGGRLDIATAPELEKILPEMDGIKQVVVDMAELTYLSSAGLRVLKKMINKIDNSKDMEILNASDEVFDVLDITGFADMVNIKR